jgi:DNA polymerase (family 10)
LENAEIARALSEIADLLEIQDENPFKVRAYRNAVRTISNLTKPLSGMVAAGEDLTELPGIGKDIAGYIQELVATGHTRRLDQLERKLPGSLADLMRLDGLGPKRARQLHDELGIDCLKALSGAIESGRLEALKGFGPKTIARIRHSLEVREQRPQRFKLSDADQFVHSLLRYMQTAPGLERIEAAGSWRRRAETVGDIDLLAICEHAEPVMRHFSQYPEIGSMEAAGPTRGTGVLKCGLQVDLRILPRESYGAALHYFTGSKAHNIAVRKLGVSRGLKISEYGVFRVGRRNGRKAAHETRVAGEREEDVFEAVGMAWVPPELREDHGEIEAALEGRLPRLITLADIRGDLQMHSTWTDGLDTIEAMARGCVQRGYAYAAFTDHSKAVSVAHGLGMKELARQEKEIQRARRKFPGLRILHGLEVDILRDGSLDATDEMLSLLDIVVISVHSHLDLPRTRMTDRVIRALQHPGVDILGHPTGRLINEREPCDIDMNAVLVAAAELGVAVELNAQPNRLDLRDAEVRRAKELGVLVAINTDAHAVSNLDFMRFGIDQARRGWLEKGNVLNAMTPTALAKWLDRATKRAAAARTA